MATLDQQRAQLAFEHVQPYVEHGKLAGDRQKYATLVHKLPALISGAGLCQALYFIKSRKERAGDNLLEHLARQLSRVGAPMKNADDLLARVRGAELGEYLHLTREAMACAAWYRRMVQGVLKVEMAESDGGS